MSEDYDIHKHTSIPNKKGLLGRYLFGLGIGVLIGVSQSVSIISRHIWWWPTAVGIAGAVVMIIGFEMMDSGEKK